MPQPLANFSEEFSAKIPALTLLSKLGYTFILPADCLAMRMSQNTLKNKSLSYI